MPFHGFVAIIVSRSLVTLAFLVCLSQSALVTLSKWDGLYVRDAFELDSIVGNRKLNDVA